jgi:hypothetical protein
MSDAEKRAQLAQVETAVGDPRWEFRTVTGIARDTGLDPDEVAKVLASHPDIARRSAMTDRNGHALYAAPDRRVPLREKLERIRWVLAH